MRYMVVWIQNHDKFIVLIWKTLDMRFGCKIRINSLHSVTNNAVVVVVVFFLVIAFSVLRITSCDCHLSLNVPIR